MNLPVTFGYSYTVRDPQRRKVEENSQNEFTTSVESQINFTDDPT